MNVLFLCTGNSARSQMAEGFARTYAKQGNIWSSAGLWPSKEVDPRTVLVMAEIGIDISNQKTKAFTDIPKPIDQIVAVCGQTAEECPKPPPGTQLIVWDLPDPVQHDATGDDALKAFRDVRDAIERHVLDYLRKHRQLKPEGQL